MHLPGHLAQILGDVMEDEFVRLLGKLGYRVVKRRHTHPSIDVISDFPRKPLDGSQGAPLRPPWFAPAGRTAFSVKEGSLRAKHVTELRRSCSSARRSHDPLLKRISGGVLATNEVLPLSKIDKIRGAGVYCWDMRRLLFYSAKARIVNMVGEKAGLIEYPLNLFEEASCLLRVSGPSGSRLDCNIFLDDHRRDLGAEDVSDLLREAHRIALAPVARNLPSPITATLSLHVLGTVDPDLARNSYDEFRRDTSSHRRIGFLDSSCFRVYQYGPAAWSSLL